MLRIGSPEAFYWWSSKEKAIFWLIIFSVKIADCTPSSDFSPGILFKSYRSVYIHNCSCYVLRSHKLSTKRSNLWIILLWWSSLFIPANKPLATLFRSSLAQFCLGQWIALSFILSRGYFSSNNFFFFYFYIWLSLSLFFRTVICGSPTCMASCGTVTFLPLKSSRMQPFSPSICPLAREALIQDGSPLPIPLTRGVMSQWSKVAGWPQLLPNLYFSALCEWFSKS